MNHSSRATQRGFSLVELMVVVAIIGVLSAIAIPNIQKYIAKARQTEAKTQLAGLYTSEKAFFAEYSAYHGMFGAVGYSPEGQLRYNIGFSTIVAEAGAGNGYNTVPAAPGNVRTANLYCGAAGAMVNNCSLLNGATNAAAPAVPAAGTINITTFTAAAIARISANSGVDDTWTIDQNKVITNTQDGIR